MRPRGHLQLIRLLAVALVASAIAGCAGVGGLSDLNRPANQIVWPPASPNAAVRVRLLGSLDDPARAEKPSFWRAFGDLVFGRKAPGFIQPHGVLATPDGDLFVTDTGGCVVHWFDLDAGRYRATYAADGILQSPVGLAYSSLSKDVFLTDSAEGRLLRFDRQAAKWEPWAAGVAFARATGIAVHPRTSEVYVVDSMEHCVKVIARDGKLQRMIGERGLEPGQFNFPVGIAFDANGEWFIVDTLNFRVQHFGPDDRLLGGWGLAGDAPGAFATIKSVAVDSGGRVYVIDSGTDVLHVFDGDGAFLFDVGQTGEDFGQFWLPSGVSIAPDGLMIVTDTHNRRLQVLRVEFQ
jgi:tripartite motif-containing protein 71